MELLEIEVKYYRYNYLLLSLIGLWPYDNTNIRHIQGLLIILLFISLLTFQFMKLFVPGCSLDLLLEVLAFNSFCLIWFIEFISYSFLKGNIKKLRRHIRSSWSILVNDQEIDIMHKYVNFGKQSTIAIIIFAYSASVGYIVAHYIPDILDILKPLNESRPHILLHQIKYFTNQDKYMSIIIMHEAIGILTFVTTGIAAETYSLVNAINAFGMFRVASYRMEHMLTVDVSQLSTAKGYIVFHDKIIAAVDTHRKALEISELLKASLGIQYFLMLLTTISSATVSLYRLFRVIMLQQEKIELIKLFFYVGYILILLLIVNFVGQEFINRDDHVHRMICNTKWYNVPVKIQKLILFLFRKTVKPYKVDALGMFSPCLEGLATTMSLLLSFLTILCSI